MTELENEKLAGLDIRLGNVEKAIEKIIKNDLPHLNLKLNFVLGFMALVLTFLGILVVKGG